MNRFLNFDTAQYKECNFCLKMCIETYFEQSHLFPLAVSLVRPS
jgi:hypothetical protein